MKPVDRFEDYIRDLVNYDPMTGVFTWAKPGKKRSVGKPIGSRHPVGYTRVCINHVDHLAHRLAWWYFYGVVPEYEIDHINGVKTDNRIANLRDIPHQVNQQNWRVARAGNTSGYLGVDWSKRNQKYRARIRLPDGQTLNLGMFHDPAEAHRVYVEAKREHHAGGTL